MGSSGGNGIASIGGTGVYTRGGSVVSLDAAGATRNQLDDGNGNAWVSQTLYVSTAIAGYGAQLNINTPLYLASSAGILFETSVAGGYYHIIADGANAGIAPIGAGDLVIEVGSDATGNGKLQFCTQSQGGAVTQTVLIDGSGNMTVTGTVVAPHVNATPSTPALPANPPVSGTVYQNTTGGPINIIIPITATAIGGSAQLALGSTNTPGNWGGAEQIGVSGELHNVTLRVPNDWYWSVTTNNATIGTANALGE